MASIKQLYNNGNTNYDEDLISFAGSHKSWAPLLTGSLLALLAASSLFIVYKYSSCDTCLWVACIITALLTTAAIVCFHLYKKNMQQQAIFQQERIFLRDLAIAMNLASSVLPEIEIQTSVKDKDTCHEHKIKQIAIRYKQKERIIQALLNRYPN